MLKPCGSAIPAFMNEDLFADKVDLRLSALCITGIALLIIGASIGQGYIVFDAIPASYISWTGSILFGVGGLALLIRTCRSE